MTLLEQIKNNRPILLWAEAAALLHDLGKLSKAFLDSRKNWRMTPGGSSSDPHVQKFLVKHDSFIIDGRFEELKQWFNNPVMINREKVSIRDIMDHHVEPSETYFLRDNNNRYTLLKMIKAADGKDASIDRNNPLFSAGQKGDPFDTDVFGMEHPDAAIIPVELESRRKCLYEDLSEVNLPDGKSDISIKDRTALFKTIRKHFAKAFSDTTRPNNDTSLWEHSYAVASILKVMMVHELIYNERIMDFKKIRFSILGVGWDGLSFISCGHKIRDIIGKKDCIKELKDKIRDQVEYKFFLGNTIYEDDNGIYFLIPRLPSQIDLEAPPFSGLERYGRLLQNLRNDIFDIALKYTKGDIYPRFHMINNTAFMTHLVNCYNAIKKKTAYPLTEPNAKWISNLKGKWHLKCPQDVCPICRRRPIISDKQKICAPCRTRRTGYFKTIVDPNNCKDTPFISEIARGSGNKKKDSENIRRAALIVAKIGLESWLNGRMIRSLFVTEAKGLEKETQELGLTKDFEADEIKLRIWLETSPYGNLFAEGYDYHRISKEIDRIYGYEKLDKEDLEYAENTIFLYDRRTIGNTLNNDVRGTAKSFKEILDSAISEYGLAGQDTAYLLHNTICAKTPTPSTILDVWYSTEGFLSSFRESVNGKILGFDPAERWTATLTRGEMEPRTPHKGKIGQKEVEIVWPTLDSDTIWIMGDIETLGDNDEVFLDDEVTARNISNPSRGACTYYPLRIITTTPDIFMALVPARDALNVSNMIFDSYQNQFGKVMGRLPLSIGNIFFPENMPMFVVLDSGRRMIRNFEELHRHKAVLRVSKDHKPCNSVEGDICILFDELKGPKSDDSVSCQLKWKMPFTLEKGSSEDVHPLIDYYHPYLLVPRGDKDYSFRKNYFRTVVGDVIHCTEVQPGDKIELYPGYYDFEFLDSNARRHDIPIEQNYRRISSVTGFDAKPCLIEEMQQKIMELWDNFKNAPKSIELTDTKLRNLHSLWLTKYLEWKVRNSDRKDKAFRLWIDMVLSSIKKEFQGFNAEFTALLRETIESGLFFETLELFYGVMKDKLDQEEGEEQHGRKIGKCKIRDTV